MLTIHWLEVAAQFKVWIEEKKKEKGCGTAQGQLDIKTVLQRETINSVCWRYAWLKTLWLIFNSDGLQLPDKG